MSKSISEEILGAIANYRRMGEIPTHIIMTPECGHRLTSECGQPFSYGIPSTAFGYRIIVSRLLKQQFVIGSQVAEC
jgi:hypothetical protein